MISKISAAADVLSTAGQGVIWEQWKHSPLLLFNMMAYCLLFSGTACVELCMAEGKARAEAVYVALLVCSMCPVCNSGWTGKHVA
jgi:hypothetical protein